MLNTGSHSKKHKASARPKGFGSHASGNTGQPLTPHHLAGLKAIQQKDFPKAIHHLAQVRPLFQANPDTHYFYALALAAEQQPLAALSELQQLTRHQPQFSEGLTLVAELAVEHHATLAASRAFRQLDRLGKLSPAVLALKGKYLFNHGRYDAALACYTPCLEAGLLTDTQYQVARLHASSWTQVALQSFYSITDLTENESRHRIIAAARHYNSNLLDKLLLLLDQHSVELFEWGRNMRNTLLAQRQQATRLTNYLTSAANQKKSAIHVVITLDKALSRETLAPYQAMNSSVVVIQPYQQSPANQPDPPGICTLPDFFLDSQTEYATPAQYAQWQQLWAVLPQSSPKTVHCHLPTPELARTNRYLASFIQSCQQAGFVIAPVTILPT